MAEDSKAQDTGGTPPVPGLSSVNDPRTSGYLLSAPFKVSEAQIFISSGSDVQTYRDLLDGMAKKMNDQAVDAGRAFRLQVRRWEGAAPRRTGGDGNREFRYDAAHSHLVVVLLQGELRPGTHEEIEEAMAGDEAQVAVIWIMPPPKGSRKPAVKWLHQKMDEYSSDFRWERVHTSLEAIYAMVGVLTRVLIDLADQENRSAEAVYSETR